LTDPQRHRNLTSNRSDPWLGKLGRLLLVQLSPPHFNWNQSQVRFRIPLRVSGTLLKNTKTEALEMAKIRSVWREAEIGK